mmetsp:Transcript_6171/g.15491  ORF Transcript_6171/g.15491 Transcript_6171/m.15491 type:complete len:408 (+) Transcript_6171:160-1383(+)
MMFRSTTTTTTATTFCLLFAAALVAEGRGVAAADPSTTLLRAAASSSSSGSRQTEGDSTNNNGVVLVGARGLFEEWMSSHAKQYTSQQEQDDKFKIWLGNHVRIEAHNNQVDKPTFTLGHNEYSDLTEQEFALHFKLGSEQQVSAAEVMKARMEQSLTGTGRGASSSSKAARHLEEGREGFPLNLPDEINWIGLGGVTDVKNQGGCGSCWAFSTTGALEGAKFVKTGELVALSEQNLLDCDHKDLGCRGGLMDNAFKFDEKTGGLCSEADYPYVAKQGSQCLTNCTDVPGTIVKTFYDVPKGSPKSLMAALAMQPISVAVQANQFVFQFYKTGVLTDDSCGKMGQLDHGVLAVGYGTDQETQEPYWLVKNSWGATWGENGYIKMSRKSKNEFGMCAILKMASYPVVE